MDRKRKLFSEETPKKVIKINEMWGKKNMQTEAEEIMMKENRQADQIEDTSQTPCTPKSMMFSVERKTSSNKTPNRNFRDQWKNGRPWLKYNPATRGMTCTVCQRAQVKNYFSIDQGCTVLKHENISRHEEAKGKNSHSVALKLIAASQDFECSQNKLLEKSEASVVAAMKNIYFMAKFNLANSLFGELNKHCIDQGCNELTGLKVDSHTTYEHSDSIHEFQQAITEVIMEENIEKIWDNPFSIMIDESTDVSVDQNLLIYCRYLNKNLGRFEPKSILLSVRKLKEVASADKVTKEVLDCLAEYNLYKINMCGIATDGAAVMVGRHSGVVTRMKEIIPGLLSAHCISRRLALASGSAADSV